ncbi:3-oxoacyl-[acyl-carrier protein] reductase [Singulisphaera sp. GP187]|uniref:SDR family NAD(P)-dependent oxidoreductase n=1 Tax=Singulisphaera sp. GP187 TaxID=1882752 RepID=UPI000929FE45|nr:glucose 1-dehydrogenase [Singulisphaera sp. GP187]SIO67747.1 3-oxoacyl-[acyl-carrier protein] reductase [Singulisphaera sp. GP187]
MANDLTSKVAVVTGASKGIGAAVARHLANAGASVVVNYSSSREGAERVVQAIEKEGGRAIAVGANLAKPEEVAKLFEDAQKAFGRLDILVNNAGIYDFAPLEGITPEHFHKHFDLNVLGLILATKEAAARFGPEGGTVINISSVVSTHPMPGASVYSATKAAVDAVTKSLAQELGGRKIRVNSINPGPVMTEGTSGFSEGEMFEEFAKKTPLGRIGQPDDIARAVLFLAGEDSGWITGEVIHTAGGLRG